MIAGEPFVGRETERKLLATLARRACDGDGSVVLVSGEAGIGKSTLVRVALAESGTTVRYGRARRDDEAAWVEALPTSADLESHARQGPFAFVLEDMQWAAGPQLMRLPEIARRLTTSVPALLVIVYRDDELGVGHPLRPMRAQLRHEMSPVEITVGPFGVTEVEALCAAASGNQATSSAIIDAVYLRSEGVPLFASELIASINLGYHGDAVGDLATPERLRDAVLLRVVGLDEPVRRELSMLAMVTDDGLNVTTLEFCDELLGCGLVVETSTGEVRFRHLLVRDVVRGAISRSGRIGLHADLATRLGASPGAAEHWLAAGDPEAARGALEAVVATRLSMGALGDGAVAARRLLELAGANRERRAEALALVAECEERLGEPGESARHWHALAREYAERDPQRCAQAWRRSATQREIQGCWEEALLAREEAAVAFTVAGRLGDAAQERLVAAAHLRSAASFRASLALLAPAARDAAAAERVDLQLRVRALEGNVRARMGNGETGIELVRGALAEALDQDLGAVAAEAYQRLADSLEHCGDYAGARKTYDDAATFCEAQGASSVAVLCLACLAVVLRLTGDWPRALAVARAVLDDDSASAHARCAAGCTVGVISALRGDFDVARTELFDAGALARQIELTAGEILSGWGFAILAAAQGSPEAVSDACRRLLERWATSEDRHIVVSPLRWAVTALAERGDPEGTRACTEALIQIAAEAGQPAALSALSHALGESAMLEGDWSRAHQQFTQAGRLLEELGGPFERMESKRRAAAALLACGRQDEAVDDLFVAYRLARRLRARPSIQRLAAELADLGERVDRRLSRLQVAQLASAQLTRRELEVLSRLVAGETNREMAASLTLSVRTVDMHVRNILRKLDCRSRTDATRRASELGLVPSP